ncbi:MAG: hypothetical protein FWE28_01990 [Oscillospiraceae bacterium]|nr:hypothetical protein [Oscillospiraceae bacterium]
MKKVILFCLVLLLALTATACGGGEGTREPILSPNMVEVEFGGLQLTFSEDIAHDTFGGRLILTFTEESDPTTGAVLNTPETGIDFSRDFFEQIVDRMDRTLQGEPEELTVNGAPAYLQHFEDYFVFVMFTGNSGVYGINFSAAEDTFDLYFPYFMDVLEQIQDGESDLVGTWSRDGAPDTLLIFNEDGTGELDIGIATLEFTWTAESGTLLLIGDGVRDESGFFIDGDTLIRTNASGEETRYTRASQGTVADSPAPEEPEEQEVDEPVAPEEPQEQEVEPQTAETLEGTWLWMGTAYYVLETGGRGTMVGSDIRWSTSRGVLSICSTPDTCGNTCIAPTEWHYVLAGNELTLTSTIMDDMTFVYTRR